MVWGRGAACCAPTFVFCASCPYPGASCLQLRAAQNPCHARKCSVSPPNRLRAATPRTKNIRMETPWHPRVSMHRRSLRLRGHDYSSPGAYFVTICASSHLFGRVRSARMMLSRFGEIARLCWMSIPRHFPHVRIDAFVVMPDHMHGILVLGARYPRACAVGRISAGSLGVVVRSFKSAVASRINVLRGAGVGGIWQRNYFDQVVRNVDDLNRVRQYIRDNPARWGRNRTSEMFGGPL